MNDTAKKIRQLQKMLEQAEQESWVPEDPADPETIEDPAPDTTDQAAEDDQDGDDRPESLAGVRLIDILTMEVDGALNEEEMTWLGSKSIPAGPGVPRRPNLKYINRKKIRR